MTNKEVITAFYKEFFNDHIIESADKYVREDYIQHNPGVAQGREGLKDAFRKMFANEPTFHLVISKMIEEDNTVAVLHKKVDPEGNTCARIVDIYRLVDGKLAEHWDVLMPLKK